MRGYDPSLGERRDPEPEDGLDEVVISEYEPLRLTPVPKVTFTPVSADAGKGCTFQIRKTMRPCGKPAILKREPPLVDYFCKRHAKPYLAADQPTRE